MILCMAIGLIVSLTRCPDDFSVLQRHIGKAISNPHFYLRFRKKTNKFFKESGISSSQIATLRECAYVTAQILAFRSNNPEIDKQVAVYKSLLEDTLDRIVLQDKVPKKVAYKWLFDRKMISQNLIPNTVDISTVKISTEQDQILMGRFMGLSKRTFGVVQTYMDLCHKRDGYARVNELLYESFQLFFAACFPEVLESVVHGNK